VTGEFGDIRLGFTPEPLIPLEERSVQSPNYHVAMAYVHVYLNGKDAAESLPSTHFLWLLDHLLHGLGELIRGKDTKAEWTSDPWRFEFRSIPEQNQIFITLQAPGKWIAMQDVCVLLDQFGREVIRMTKQWQQYLKQHYADEIYDLGKKREPYRLFLQHLENAQNAMRQYEQVML
jgi:hypothetical protein